MIVGIGVDVVDLARFERAATRTPRLLPRLFAESERVVSDGAGGSRVLSLRSLAARYAAKEALIKAIGHSDGVFWHDMRVIADERGNPRFETSGALTEWLVQNDISTVHVSLSHDAGVAIAYVIAESAGSPR